MSSVLPHTASSIDDLPRQQMTHRAIMPGLTARCANASCIQRGSNRTIGCRPGCLYLANDRQDIRGECVRRRPVDLNALGLSLRQIGPVPQRGACAFLAARAARVRSAIIPRSFSANAAYPAGIAPV